MVRSRAPLTSLTLRQCREALALSQAAFAAQLGVSLETYRTWDSGRRPVRLEILTRANEMALRHDPQALLPLETLLGGFTFILSARGLWRLRRGQPR